MTWVSNFTSSNVSAFRWHDPELLVRFHDGSVYSYPASYQTYLDMLDAPSKGKFVWRELRGTGEHKVRGKSM